MINAWGWPEGSAHEEVDEEIGNSLTHLLGFVVSCISTYVLILASIAPPRSWHNRIGLASFGCSMMLLYACSTTYHVIGIYFNKDLVTLSKWRVLDHMAIYYLIAGSYTPLTLLLIIKSNHAPKLGYAMLGFVWTCAFLGSTIKAMFSVEVVPEWVSTAFYLFMGWAVVLVFQPVRAVTPPKILLWIVIGGLSYSVGIIFLLWDSLHFNHMIWHLFVMVGTAAHCVAVILCVYLDAHNDNSASSHKNFELSESKAISFIIQVATTNPKKID